MERRLSEEQSWNLLTQLFPSGLEDSALIQELAPEGWEGSPLRRVFHPTVDQMYAEAVRIHANIQKLLPAGARAHETAPPSFDEIRRQYREDMWDDTRGRQALEGPGIGETTDSDVRTRQEGSALTTRKRPGPPLCAVPLLL